MRKTKICASGGTMISACLIGLLIAELVMIGGAVIGAIFILNEYFTEEAAAILTIMTQFASVLLGSFFAGKLVKENKILSSILTAVAYFVSLLGIALLLFDGIGSQILTGVLVCAISCLGGIVLSTKEKIHIKRRRRRTHSR